MQDSNLLAEANHGFKHKDLAQSGITGFLLSEGYDFTKETNKTQSKLRLTQQLNEMPHIRI